jgi:peroxiredoxin
MQTKIALCIATIVAISIPVWAQTSLTTPEAPSSPQKIRPVLIGAAVPDVTLETVAGEQFDLKKSLTDKPGVIIFYRGGWCPFCNRHLAQLQEIQSKLVDLGYQVLAISPDQPTKLAESQEKIKPSYTLLSDRHMTAASAFGITFRVDDATLVKYRGYGINLETASGENHHLLPVPSVFIVGKDGKIGFTYVNPDYKVRIDPDVLLAAAKAVLKQ